MSPLTPDDLLPSIGLGAIAALGLFVYLHRATRADTGVYWDGRRRIDAVKIREVAPSVWAALFLFGLVFAPTMLWMYSQWTGSVWQNNHGIFMPVLMFFLARSVLRREETVEDDSSPWGFAWLAVGITLVVLDSAAGTRYLSAIGLVVCLPGLSLLILGRQRTKALRVVLMLGIFMVPIPATLSNHLVLRNATAAGTLPLLRMLGIPSAREHSVLDVADSIFVVSDACSGFATTYSALALTIFLVCYCQSPWRRALLIASFLPLALAANVLRVFMLVLIALADFSLLDTPLHEASGVASFCLIIAILFTMADRQSLRNAFA
ncbi:MAG: exosortase/archaeosortase family protein [Proteobacteria bacterium]|nr:exosortase/archaeosortase family protein [Pseudomonadota bacterium]